MKLFKKYLHDESGQFAIMVALVSTLLLGGVMVAVDIGSLVKTKTKVAAITDAAALAGANAFDNPKREEIVLKFLETNSTSVLKNSLNGAPIIKFDDNAGEVSVSINAQTNFAFGSILGFKNKDVGFKSVAGYPNTLDPLSIAFALDVSGSMGDPTTDGQIKLAALKVATTQMFNEIEANIRNKESIDKYIRTGLSAFNGTLTAEHPMSWGFVEVETAIQNLNSGGWTNTKVALENAHKQLLDDRHFRLAANPALNLATLDEFVIFMTDGTNTAGDTIVLDEDSYQSCVAMREDGIEVFAVAFAAPQEGQVLLLDCASLDDPNEDRRASAIHNERNRCGKNDDDDDLADDLGDDLFDDLDDDLGDVDDDVDGVKGCMKNARDVKKDHYFDASDAQSFKEIFKVIGRKINESAVRLKS